MTTLKVVATGVFLYALICSAHASTSCVNELLVTNYDCDLSFISVIVSTGHCIVDDLNCDVMIEKSEFDEQPVVAYYEADENATYAFMMLDRDAADLSKGEFWLHWLVTNIKGADLIGRYESSGKIIKNYKVPEPNEGSGLHRLLFLLFEQVDSNQNVTPPEDSKIHMGRWLDKQRGKLCGPIAGVQCRITT